MPIDILIIGSGGREHALGWKLRQSPRCGKLYFAPGNGGTEQLGKNVALDIADTTTLVQFVQENRIAFTIVGPEEPLASGIIDIFKQRGLRIFGPSKAAAKIEWSKAFSKEVMHGIDIPTASFEVCREINQAINAVRRKSFPVVIKAVGLAKGKGVFICKTLEEATNVLQSLLVDHSLGEAGGEVIVEEYLEGPEISIQALCDGSSALLFPPSQDHKRIGEGDTGKNTGGIGVIAPVPWFTAEQFSIVEHRIVKASLDYFIQNGIYYQGVLYPGLKVTIDGIKVLEFNARFGDPECQAYMRLMKSDLLPILEACVDGSVADMQIDWSRGFVAAVVLCAAGYPDAYKTGAIIQGIADAQSVPQVIVFHSGTANDGEMRVAGGRVLTVTATGATLAEALSRVYAAIGHIQFEGMYYRRDIGASEKVDTFQK